jgi:hypothetical protein
VFLPLVDFILCSVLCGFLSCCVFPSHTILAVRSFRVASIIIAHFDLEIKQFNVVNIFINIEHDSNGPKVVVKLLDGFK